MQTADAEVRLQSAQSVQPSEAAAAVSDSPSLSKSTLPQQASQLVEAESPAKSASYQPTRFATEAAREADVSNGDTQFDATRQGHQEEETAAAVAKGPSDTPWLGREAEQANEPAQPPMVTQQSSDFDSRQSGGFEGRAGRIPDQPQGPGQGSLEQPQHGSGTDAIDSNAAPGLSGVEQVLSSLQLWR